MKNLLSKLVEHNENFPIILTQAEKEILRNFYAKDFRSYLHETDIREVREYIRYKLVTCSKSGVRFPLHSFIKILRHELNNSFAK